MTTLKTYEQSIAQHTHLSASEVDTRITAMSEVYGVPKEQIAAKLDESFTQQPEDLSSQQLADNLSDADEDNQD